MRVARVASPQGTALAWVDGAELRVLPVGRRETDSSLAALLSRNDRHSGVENFLRRQATSARPIEGAPLRAPIHDPSKIIGIGLNYVDHAAEISAEMPTTPLVFAKFPSAIIGPGEDIRWDPRLTAAVDYEAELAVVIGRRCQNISERDALDCVFGYTCLNDVSARDLQFGDVQWVRGKSLDTFCPVGPVVVTRDEIADPQQLTISCSVSGETLQSASTRDMYFSVAELISHLSRWFALEPGDVIATGTPPGVGYFRNPRRTLRDGDEVTVTLDQIGALTNPCRTLWEPPDEPADDSPQPDLTYRSDA